MSITEFESHIANLRLAVICTMEKHFESQGASFDVGKFLSLTDVDLDQFVRDAYFLGAEIFPISTQKP